MDNEINTNYQTNQPINQGQNKSQINNHTNVEILIWKIQKGKSHEKKLHYSIKLIIKI